jgi:HK97 family phage major capsid protein
MPLTADDLRNVLKESEGRIDSKLDAMKEAVNEQVEARSSTFQTGLTEANDRVNTLEEELRGEYRSMSEQIAEFGGKFDVVEKFIGRNGALGGDMPAEEMKTVGGTFAESEALKEMLERGGNSTNRVNYRSILRKREQRAATITNADTGWGGAGALITPFELGETIMDPRRTFMIRDLLRVIPVQSDAVHFAEMTGFANLYAEVTTLANAGATAVIINDVAGFFIGQRVMIGTESKVVTGVNTTTNTLTIGTALVGAAAVGTVVQSDQLAAIPHGGRKPQASLKFEDRTLPISTLAHWIAVHRQTLSDAPQLQAIIDSELRYGLALAEEDQILFGNGTSPNLTGIMTNANIVSQGAPAGADNKIDHLRRGLTKTEVTGIPPNGIIMNPIDWEGIELLKDSTGRYLWFNIQSPNSRNLFAVPVVTTTAMPAGSWLTGSFGMGAYLFDREQANVRISESHSTFFTENMVAILAEERLGLGVVRPEAFIKGTF